MEGQKIRLAKARYEDWPAIWRNVWSRPEAARYMLWRVTETEDEARERMRRTLAWQAEHDAWFIYEEGSGQAIGFAGAKQVRPGLWEDTGLAIGPDFTRRGYGRQALTWLLGWCARERGAKRFRYTARRQNEASRALASACGFAYAGSVPGTDPRTGEGYILDIYEREV